MREILCVHQPCVLCEGDLQVWVLFRDEETGAEEVRVDNVAHECAAMRALLSERVKSARTPRG